MIEAYNRMHDVLTPEQRAALIDELQVHWANWKDAQRQDEQSTDSKYPGHLAVLTQKLSLSQEQVDRIKANYLSGMTVVPEASDHKAVEAHLQAFTTAFKTDTFDAKKLDTEQGADAHMATWGATRMERFFQAFAPVLTPTQRANLAQEIRDHASRHDS
jgi:Spy/CpxP family protein refolding chaperone